MPGGKELHVPQVSVSLCREDLAEESFLAFPAASLLCLAATSTPSMTSIQPHHTPQHSSWALSPPPLAFFPLICVCAAQGTGHSLHLGANLD